MPGKPAKPSGLFDDGSLMSFLQSTLETMELAAGEPLGAERAKLQELQRALGGLGAVGGAAIPADTDELVLASQLDKLEEQLSAVEQQIAVADNGTKQLLTAAVSNGITAQTGGQQAARTAAAAASVSSAAAPSSRVASSSNGSGSSNSSAGYSAPAAGSGNVVGGGALGGASADALLAAGLLPVTEQLEEPEGGAACEQTDGPGS